MQGIDREEWRRRDLEQLAEMYNMCEDLMRSCNDAKLRAAAERRLNRIAASATRLGGVQFLTQVYTSKAIARVQGLQIVTNPDGADNGC